MGEMFSPAMMPAFCFFFLSLSRPFSDIFSGIDESAIDGCVMQRCARFLSFHCPCDFCFVYSFVGEMVHGLLGIFEGR